MSTCKDKMIPSIFFKEKKLIKIKVCGNVENKCTDKKIQSNANRRKAGVSKLIR